MEKLASMMAGVLGIIVIDLVLSGDNALVIGMAARRLPPRQRRLAIILGGGAAIGLRVLFAVIAALLLAIPFLQAAGGLLLLWVAWKLLRESGPVHEAEESISVVGALKTIVVADVVMSLDNILAIAGVSHGDILLLLFGLLVSMPLILFGSGIIASLMNRVPWLGLLGAAILAWAAGSMIIEDEVIGHLVPYPDQLHFVVPAVLTIAVLIPSLVEMARSEQAAEGIKEGAAEMREDSPVEAMSSGDDESSRAA